MLGREQVSFMYFLIYFVCYLSYLLKHVNVTALDFIQNWKICFQILIVLSGGTWNPYYRPAWRSAAAQLRTSGIDTYCTGVLPQDASSYFRDISEHPSKAYPASTDFAMDSYRPEMIRQIVFGGIATCRILLFCSLDSIAVFKSFVNFFCLAINS